MAVILATIQKTKDTSIVAAAGKKKKTMDVQNKKKLQNVDVHILTTKTKVIIVAVVQKIKAMVVMALEILVKTITTDGKNKLR